ncbi:YgdI/YgdR family lipoprotein [Bacillus sp. FJAT-29790]|uniref:YgdI/YgdR family lipoprotein n=1 Tax=Bacillus sp. FJAT-29790 TaxID=1895002 RepID=UPI001C232E4F|nr:YgdI/YgdR family lipoprotein [Bacillus sp. FJAT-29790]MBU8879533.1 YgdI/YgdR family lipoprotein [Bacillus sp. FJAT-29790]
MKKLLALLTIFSLLFAVAGCSSKKEETTNKGTEEKAAGLTDTVKSKMYNSVRVAELKVNEVFHKETAGDGEIPIINGSFAEDNKAVEFLSKYYSEEVAKDIYAHYATVKKTAEGQMIINAEPYFTPSFLETSQQDVTIEGDEKKATIKSAGMTYHVELKDGQYIITSVEK